jgi:Cation/multidrug efflux pump
MNDISRIIGSASINVPAGTMADGALRVRSLGLKEIAKDYSEIEILSKIDGSRVLLGDIARISEKPKEPVVEFFRNGNRAVNIHVQRSKTNDAIQVNKNVQNYIKENINIWPQTLKVEQFGTVAVLISDRINLLVENATSGLIIVLIVLFIFLSSKTAFWVAVGIPVAFCATFLVMLVTGQTINMISLFGLIMALGIVVDDAIVVGEHSEHLEVNRGLSTGEAAITSASRMAPPVISAMLTTVAAFLNLFFIKGVIGQII